MHQSLSFGEFELRPRHRQLLRNGREVPITTRAFDLLVHLVTRTGELVTKDELVAAVWKGGAVTDAALTKRVQELRAALRDSARAPRYLRTVTRRGFRFVADVTTTLPVTAPPPAWFVGRASERDRLRTLLAQATQGRRTVVFVSGPAGIGKSALLDSMLRDPVAESFLVGRGACFDQTGAGEAFGEPFLPLLDALAHAMRQVAGRPLTAALQTYAPAWLRQLPGFVDERDVSAIARRAVGITQPRLLRELTDACDACTETRALLIALEDVQWSDPGVLAWIEHFARRPDPTRAALVMTVRAGPDSVLAPRLETLMSELLRHELAHEVRVTPLTREDVRGYAKHRLEPERDAEESLVDTLWDRSNGHALLMRTATDDLVRAASGTSGGTRSPRSGLRDTASIPNGLQHLAEQHLAASDPLERLVLHYASALGRPFIASLIASIERSEAAAMDAACSRLVQRGVLLPAHVDAYAILHGLLREALYSAIPADERRRVHLKIATYLEAANGEPKEVATHFERAGAATRGLRHHVAAGVAAMRGGSQAEAERHFEKAVALRTDERADHVWLAALYSGLGMVRGVMLGVAHPDSAEAYHEALEHTRAVPHTHSFQPLYGLCCHHLLRSEVALARRYAEELARLAAEAVDPLLRTWSVMLDGRIAYFNGEIERARALFERVLAEYPEGVSDPYVELTWVTPDVLSSCYVASAYSDLGFPDSALRSCEQAIARSERLGSLYALAFSHYAMAQTRFVRMEIDLARQHAQRGLEIASTNHYPLIATWAEATLCAATPGDVSVARLMELLGGLDAMGVRLQRASGHLAAATMLADRGRIDEALAEVDRGVAGVLETGERVPRVALWFERGAVLTRDPIRRAEAPAAFEEARREARSLGARGWLMRGTLGLASALRDQPERFRAATMEAAALYGEYTEGEDTLGLRLARLYCQLAGVPVPQIKVT